MAAQTKLTSEQKVWARDKLIEMRLKYGAEVMQDAIAGLTVIIQPAFMGSRMAVVSLAWTAPTEKRFRKTAGLR